MPNRFCCFLAGLAAFSLPVIAQVSMTSASTATSGSVVRGTMHFAARPFVGTPVTGAPYSAQRVSEHVQVAADGTRFTTTTQQETIYRDSQGRTRTERPMIGGMNAPDAPLLVEISDPVANVGYTLDTQNKVAHRVTYSAASGRQTGVGKIGSGGGGSNRVGVFSESVAPPPGRGTPPALITSPLSSVGTTAAGPASSHPEVNHEDLGSQMVEGVMAKGERFVQTWPVGSQGNDRPFQSTTETWYSSELKLMVLSKNSDPRTGEHTTKLINISQSEPPATLFAPPSDYTVVDEEGPFEIRWTGTRQQ